MSFIKHLFFHWRGKVNNIRHAFEPLEGRVIFIKTNEVKRGRDPNNGGSFIANKKN